MFIKELSPDFHERVREQLYNLAYEIKTKLSGPDSFEIWVKQDWVDGENKSELISATLLPFHYGAHNELYDCEAHFFRHELKQIMIQRLFDNEGDETSEFYDASKKGIIIKAEDDDNIAQMVVDFEREILKEL